MRASTQRGGSNDDDDDGSRSSLTSREVTADVLQRLRAFFVQHCAPPQRYAALAEGQEEASQEGRVLLTQEVDCMLLLDCVPELCSMLFANALALLNLLSSECAALCRDAGHVLAAADLSIRLSHVPMLGTTLPSLPPPHGQLVQVCGTVVRMTARRVIPYVYRVMCPRCRGVVEVHSNRFDRAVELKPRCEQPGCRGEEQQVVGRVWMDYAECRLQQRSNQSGQMPRSVLVTLDDDLTSRCSVGQFVEVVGLLFPKWRHMVTQHRPSIEPAIWAVHVLPMEAYRGATLASSGGGGGGYASMSSSSSGSGGGGGGMTMAGVGGMHARRRAARGAGSYHATYTSGSSDNGSGGGDAVKFSPDSFFLSFCKDKRRRGVALACSVCPQLAGLYGPRMAVLLSALGGASTAGKAAMHIRSTIHCLLVGDPATGKSQLLRFAAAVAPRSTSTTGMGSTSAGLTVAATKEQGEWVLEPGALVLSDGGTCIIDELRTVSPADRASLHEAMEQQTISVAKGGLVTKLRTACAVLAACNPPSSSSSSRHGGALPSCDGGGGGAHAPVEVGVGGPLLSRFDFIFLLWDSPQEEHDARIAEHVLSCSVVSHYRVEPPLAADELARYLWWVRAQYANVDGPLLSDEAAELLGTYYDLQRERGATPSLNDVVPVTVRLLESLVRITQAHAKLHLQPLCTLDDAAVAVFLLERTAHSLKCPLSALGSDVYSSSREMDALFLSDSAECLEQQDMVLAALVQTLRQYKEMRRAHGDGRDAGSAYDDDVDNNNNDKDNDNDATSPHDRYRSSRRAPPSSLLSSSSSPYRHRGGGGGYAYRYSRRNGSGGRSYDASMPYDTNDAHGDGGDEGSYNNNNVDVDNDEALQPLAGAHDAASLLEQRKQRRPSLSSLLSQQTNTTTAAAAAAADGAARLARELSMPTSLPRECAQYGADAYRTPSKVQDAQQLLASQCASTHRRRDVGSLAASAATTSTSRMPPPPSPAPRATNTAHSGCGGGKRVRSADDIMQSLRFHY